jgi:putative phosphoribosyl transferase
MFHDRSEAGTRLAEMLNRYKGQKELIVLGLARGGVVTAAEVARYLKVPLDVICPRKVGAPENPELALGAITETGEGFFNEALIAELKVSKKYLDAECAKEQKKAQMRMELFRKGRLPLQLRAKTVILVDDGLATGATMKAAILSLRKQKVEKIVVAVPVAPPDTAAEVQKLGDEFYCMEIPWFFQAVGQFYEDFSQTEDEEVVQILQQFYRN